MAAPVKTPYQGKNQCQGFFNCNHGHRWPSQYSWANCGQRCKKCLERVFGKSLDKISKDEALAVEYTYPFSQIPLEGREVYLSCDKCDHEEEAMFPKKRKCLKAGCQGFLVPWNYLRCPHCDYKHEWSEDRKTARRLEFVCKDYAEGKGCDNVIGFEKTVEPQGTGLTGPHPGPLCEKCEQLGKKCTGHRRRSKGKNKRSTASSISVDVSKIVHPSSSPGFQTSGDINNNDTGTGLTPQSGAKKRINRRSKRMGPSKQGAGDAAVNELCHFMKKL